MRQLKEVSAWCLHKTPTLQFLLCVKPELTVGIGSNPPSPSPPRPIEIDAAHVQAEMEGSLRRWRTNALMTSRFQPLHYRRAAVVANEMGGASFLREALVHLDASDWDVGGALQRYNRDLDNVQQTTQAQVDQHGHDPNRGLDRTRASGGVNWDKNKFTIRIHDGRKWTIRTYTDIDKNFNVDSPTPMEILRLNRWREETFNTYRVHLAGLPRAM